MPFRIESVLAASDLSESAREALRTAAAFAALTEAELHVVHAVAGGGAQEREPGEAARRLQEHVEAAVAHKVEVATAHLAPGHAHEVILRRAAEVGADLLVIGPHREPPARQVLGATADRIVRGSDVPCLVVHGPVSLPLRRVLVPSDLSGAAQGALDLALVWAAALRLPSGAAARTRVEVLHVLAPSTAGADASGASRGHEAARALRAQISAASERTGCATQLEVAEEVVAGGSAADEILRRARDRRVDLLVLGTRGEGETAAGAIGSVSAAVARRAECPVLLVPPALWKGRQAREAGMRPEG